MAKLVIEPYFFVLEADSHWLNLHLVQEKAKGVLGRLNTKLVHDVIKTYKTWGPAAHLFAEGASFRV
jgi:hypothetical protein